MSKQTNPPFTCSSSAMLLFASEQEAFDYLSAKGWELNSYHGALGSTFYNRGLPDQNRFVYRQDSTWIIKSTNP